MKGIKTMSLANGTSERFHADSLNTQNCVVTETLLIKNEDVGKMLKELKKENEELKKVVKELKEKVDLIEIE